MAVAAVCWEHQQQGLASIKETRKTLQNYSCNLIFANFCNIATTNCDEFHAIDQQEVVLTWKVEETIWIVWCAFVFCPFT